MMETTEASTTLPLSITRSDRTPPLAPPDRAGPAANSFQARAHTSPHLFLEDISEATRRGAARAFFQQWAFVVGEALASVQAQSAFGADPRLLSTAEVVCALRRLGIVTTERTIQRHANRALDLGLPRSMWFSRSRYDFCDFGPWPRGVIAILSFSARGMSIGIVAKPPVFATRELLSGDARRGIIESGGSKRHV
jgi:hypothetical protein